MNWQASSNSIAPWAAAGSDRVILRGLTEPLPGFGVYTGMDSFVRDIRHSLRLFWQNRGFTGTAVAALAIGIGLNTAIFSIVNAVLLKPPPFPQAGRIVLLISTSPQGSGPAASPAKFAHWRQQSTVLEDVAAFRGGVINWTGGDLPLQLRSGQVSAAYFRLFGAPVLLGRTFSAEEDKPNAGHVAVISE